MINKKLTHSTSISLLIIASCLSGITLADNRQPNLTILIKTMLTNFAEAKNINAAPNFFHKDLKLHTKNNQFGYDGFIKIHKNLFNQAKDIKIITPFTRNFSHEDIVVTYIDIDITYKKNKTTKRLSDLFISRIKNGKIIEVWVPTMVVDKQTYETLSL